MDNLILEQLKAIRADNSTVVDLVKMLQNDMVIVREQLKAVHGEVGELNATVATLRDGKTY